MKKKDSYTESYTGSINNKNNKNIHILKIKNYG